MSERARTRPVHAILAVVISTALTLLAVELVLRAVTSDRYYVWPPDLMISFPSDPELTPGIDGQTTFSTNEYGIRGRTFGDDDYRILTIGGSTTESILVDDSEAWPHLLQGRLDEAFPGASVWVGNVGRSGHSSRDHALQAEKLPPQYPGIDAALVLVGVNDFSLRLRRGVDYVPYAEAPPEYHEGLLTHAFAMLPWTDRPNLPFFKRTYLWQMVRRLARPPEVPDVLADQERGPGYLTALRQRRQRAGRSDSLPDLGTALQDYAQTLTRIVMVLEDQGIKPVLLTQPYIWNDSLPAEIENLLWFGRVGSSRNQPEEIFYSSAAMAEGMHRHNEVLLAVCQERGIACIDLASALPQDTTVFYDDVHFNEPGSRQVAEVVARALAEDPDVRARLAR